MHVILYTICKNEVWRNQWQYFDCSKSCFSTVSLGSKLHMHTHEQLRLAKTLVLDLHSATPRQQRLRRVTIPLSAITTVVRTSLEVSPFFPPDAKPEELGDGAMIEHRGKYWFLVHERFEVGQLRFSKIASRRYFFLRSAVVRFLRHYRPLLRVDEVDIRWWS